MKSTRVLVLGLLLSGYIAEPAGHELGSVGNDTREFTQDQPRRPSRHNETTNLFRLMGKNTIWTRVDTVEMNWQTFHTQGLVKIGETFYVSAVEVLVSSMRAYFMTESDNQADLLVYDATPWVNR